MGCELTLQLNELFQKWPIKVELRLDLNDLFQKGPIKVEIDLKMIFFKRTYRVL